ncbi:MAG: Rrf2 family transcriptional regulator [Treponema sp.]|nr:Rrf2 family transcriptional regulator [Spirochaetia bacterium]MDD7458803.1 Rrf2 family transcriptional regulator [Spirochaetales bacterium]MDY5811936.1 Rrf2 family transcriptional regulator [Treponema sp.]MEE1182762.1 Rrf2 family transcriptional regulator [Treponema sp.]
MIKVSTRGQYALLIMTSLAEQDPEKYVPLKLLSHRHNLSVKYLEQILIQLSKAGMVVGLRGNNGGYKLKRRPEEYSAGEILRATEGPLSTHSEVNNSSFSDAGNVEFWKDFDHVMNDYVDKVTLEQLVQKNHDFAGYEYSI